MASKAVGKKMEAFETAFNKEKVNVNLIIVDWSGLAMPSAGRGYMTAAACAIQVGKYLAKCLNRRRVNKNQLHLFGHSLGGHGVGEAGRQLAKLGRKPARVTGMDPAGPCFTSTAISQYSCLSPQSLSVIPLKDSKIGVDSGVFVDIVHSNPGELGSSKNLGNVDYFVNGIMGKKKGDKHTQSECENKIHLKAMKDSHSYAVKVVVASIRGNKGQTFGKTLQKATSPFKVGSLTKPRYISGSYYLKTNLECKPKRFSSEWFAQKKETATKLFKWG